MKRYNYIVGGPYSNLLDILYGIPGVGDEIRKQATRLGIGASKYFNKHTGEFDLPDVNIVPYKPKPGSNFINPLDMNVRPWHDKTVHDAYKAEQDRIRYNANLAKAQEIAEAAEQGLFPMYDENGNIEGYGSYIEALGHNDRPLSGSDPLAEFIVANVALGKPLQAVGRGAQWIMGKAGNQWARNQIAGRVFNNAANKAFGFNGSKVLNNSGGIIETAAPRIVRDGRNPNFIMNTPYIMTAEDIPYLTASYYKDNAYLKKLIDDAFVKRSRTKLVKDGKPIQLYHGSRNRWKAYDFEEAAKNSNSLIGSNNAIFTTSNRDVGMTYTKGGFGDNTPGRLYRFYGKSENPITINYGGRNFDGNGVRYIYKDLVDGAEIPILTREGNDIFFHDIKMVNDFYDYNRLGEIPLADGTKIPYKHANGLKRQPVLSKGSTTDQLNMFNARNNFNEQLGIPENDALILNNLHEVDDILIDDYIFTNPNNLKLSNIITRDDNGYIIPLSHRFNFSTPDIRFKYGGSIPQPYRTRY